MAKLKPLVAIVFSFAAAAGYGILVRLASNIQQLSGLITTVSIGFLFFVPLGLGAVTVFFSPARYKKSWLYAIFAPWIPCLIFGGIAAVLSWEAWICVVMALPIFLAMSTVGGMILLIFYKKFDKPDRAQAGMTGMLLLTPFLIMPLEAVLPLQDSARVVHTQIEVEAEPEIVWQHITRVPEITEAEHRFSFFHLAGLPRPKLATVSYEGVGGVRRGQWEDGLAFIETISEWQPNESYTMQMAADTRFVQPSPLPLQEIGGRYFDVVEGQYAIEPIGEGKVILRFTSTYRLSTRFNFYASLWTDFFMRDVQNYILQIMKERSEAQSHQALSEGVNDENHPYSTARQIILERSDTGRF